MRIVIFALGSRGDVAPFIALAKGIQAAGHAVRVVSVDDYGALVRSYGVPWTSAGGSIQATMNPEAVYVALDGANNPLRLARTFFGEIGPLIERVMRACADAARDADLLLASTLGVFIAAHIAEAYDLPLVPCHMHPYGPTSALPSVFFRSLPTWMPLRGSYNRLSHRLTDQAYWQLLRRSLNRARRSVLALPARSAFMIGRTRYTQRGTTLYAYSPAIAPRPPDWGDEQHITGYWSLGEPDGWTPSPALARFIEAGSPPLYIGFGSMLAGRDPAAWTAKIVSAVAQTGRRAIIQSAWNDWGTAHLPAAIYRAPPAPHCWLFRHVSAVVTHGGAGTTANALHAGARLVMVPFLGDQHFWAGRVHALGLAPQPLPRHHLSAERLAARIEEAFDPQYEGPRAAISATLRSENGVVDALRVLRLK
jgi:sterol 3beta-glucosyltransferase